MKAPSRDENAQKEMAGSIEFLRELREVSGAAVCFVHHTGHQGEQMRGTSDLETVWESKLTWKKDAEGLVTVASDHREEGPGPALSYRLAWDHDTRTMRLRSATPPLREEIVEWLQAHLQGTVDEVATGIRRRPDEVRKELSRMEEAGTSHRGSSGRLDKLGRPIRDKVWKLSTDAGLWDVPEQGLPIADHTNGHRGSVGRPTPFRGDAHGTSHPDAPGASGASPAQASIADFVSSENDAREAMS